MDEPVVTLGSADTMWATTGTNQVGNAPQATKATSNSAPPDGISADEIALYDRQIRLWGMKAQEKIRIANVLLITMKALANEVAKNLVLAGIGSLTIVDHEPVTEADLGSQFFLDASLLGINRAEASRPAVQKLNPRVRVVADPGNIRAKGPSYFAPFDMIIATDLDTNALSAINTAARVNKRPLYAAGSHGLYGFIFADLIEHKFILERQISNMPTRISSETPTRSVVAVTPKPGDSRHELVTKRELYSTWYLAVDGSLPPGMTVRRRRVVTPILSCLRALWQFEQDTLRHPSTKDHTDLAVFTTLCTSKHRALGLPSETLRSDVLRAFLQNIGAELAPVTAVLGGQLAQDAINALGGNLQPIQNFVIFDGTTMEAQMYALHPEGELGSKLFQISERAMIRATAGVSGGENAGAGTNVARLAAATATAVNAAMTLG